MSKINVRELFAISDKIVVTAHRGFSGKFPENTLLSFQKAVELGVDLIEFDVRATKDLVPIILHDATLDRTTNGKGKPGEYNFDEIRRLNASYFIADGKGRRSEPVYPELPIPTLVEVFESVPESVGLNIQLYQTEPEEYLRKLCRLYDEYDVYGRGYFTVSTFVEAQKIREINDKIDICILENQDKMDEPLLKKLKEFGCDIIQPYRDCVTPELCKLINDMGFCANMFYSNTDEDNRRFIGMGMRGILTDFPDILKETIKSLGLR